ncbi:MAG TPA: ELWxxDGT repeat protein, partial [Herpetosiphonaceae bacterium]
MSSSRRPWLARMLLAAAILLLAGSPVATRAEPPSQLLVRDIQPGAAGSDPQHLAVAGDTVFFAATAPDTGRELWRSDGTPAGTALVADLQPGPASSNIRAIQPFQNDVLLLDQNTLWRSTGTAAGTTPITTVVGQELRDELAVVGEYAYFVTAREENWDNDYYLWRSDGTAGAATLIDTWHTVGWGRTTIRPIAVDNQLYVWFDFFAEDHKRYLYYLEGSTLRHIDRCDCEAYPVIGPRPDGFVLDKPVPFELQIVDRGQVRSLDLSSLPLATITPIGGTRAFALFTGTATDGRRQIW